MKKKWMGGLLALALAALCMLPTQVQAASTSTTEKHMHGDVEYKEWTDEMAVRYRGAGHTAKNSLPTGDSWNWYLTEDVTLTTRWYATFNSSGGDNVMDICLNGHTITFETTGLETNPQINRSFLTLCDCTGKGGIDLKGHNIYIASKCSLDVSDIYITGGSGDTSAVTVGYYGIFTMGDGTVIRDNTCTSEKAGGVTVEGRDSINRNNGVFIMNGGEIRRNTGGVGGVLNYGEFTINGGTIKENYGTTTGGVANSCDYKGMPEHDIPDNYGTMIIGGGAQVYGNHLRTTAGEASNLYLIDPESYPIHVSGLQSTAKIALNSWADGIVQGRVTDETLGCFSLDDPNLGVLYVENEQLKKLPAHYHCVCGAEHTVSGSHTAANLQTFTPWESEDSLPTEAGYYHLTKDVTLSETWKPKKGTVLCTNGHSIIAGGSFDIITVDSGVTFSLTDCSSEWSEYHNASALMPANAETYRGNGVRNDGTFNLYMGAIVGCVGTDGGGVYNNGTFNMYAGHIYRDGDQGGVGVVVEHGGGVLNNGTFNMYGGSIRNNGRASSVGSNVGVRYGGGVYVGTSGTFTMTGGDIMGNSVITGGQGSAIYVDDGGTLKLGKNVQIWNNNSASSIAFANDSANISIIRRLSDSAKIDIGSLSADRVTQTGNNFYTVENSRYLVSPGHIHKPDGTADPNGNDETEAIYEKWTSTDSLPTTAGAWRLMNDVTVSSGTVLNEDVTLCLNGHTITVKDGADYTYYVTRSHTLNIVDCQGSGVINGGSTAASKRAGVKVESYGTFNLYAGTIKGFGSGVAVQKSATFKMYGGAISGNHSDSAGGGVAVQKNGSFEMYGGSIVGNSAATYGGGVYDNVAYVTLYGGSITGNTAGTQGGGVHASPNHSGTELTLGGNVSITGNTLTDGTDENLYLLVDTEYGASAKISVSGLTENADIQVVEIEGREGKDYFSGVTYETLPPEVLARITTNNGSIFAWNEAHDTILLVQAVPADLMPVVAAETTLTYSGEEQTVLTVPEGADTYYTVSGEEKATDVGEYTITLRLNEGYVWPDGTETDKTIQWKIQPMKVKAPAAVTGLIYNGETKTGVAAGEGYTLEGEFKAVNAGEYTAVAKLTNTANYQWDDGTTEDKTIVWSIGEKTPAVSDFAVTYPRSEELVYNGNAKEVTAKLSDSYPAQDITLTVVYTNADGIAVEEPTNAGTYTVKLCVSGSSNFAAAELALADLTIVPMGQELSFAEARVELTYDPASTSYTQTVSGAKGPVVYRGSDDTVAAVDAATGEVTIRKAGTVVITAESDSSNHNYAQSSATYTLAIQKAAQDAPAGLEGTAPSSIGGTDGTITGVTSAMEYSADGVNYVTCPDGTLSGLNSGSYQVRFKETDTHRAGTALDVTVPVHQHTFDQKAESQQYRKADATCLSPALYYKSCACGVSSEGTAGEAIFEVGQKLGHDFQWKDYDNDYHVKQCRNGCGEWDMTTKEAHVYDGLEGTRCLTCGHDRTVNYSTVSFGVNEAEYGMVTPVQAVSRVPEGADLTVSGSTVTVKGVTVAAVASANTAQYTYAFEKWSTPNGTYTVTDDTTITAIFSRTVNQYTVAWNAQGGSLTGSCTDGAVDYGTAIQAPGADKETDEDNSYVFLGWSTTPNGAVEDVAETVTGNVTYYAQYEVQPHVWTEDWDSDDTYHWHTCTVDGCGYTKDKAEHDYTDADDTTCDTCGCQRTLPDITGTVVINGKLERGETLTAETSGMPNADLRYQWLRNGQPIEGADEAAYELTGEDIGKTISVRITAKGYAGTIETEAEGTVTVYYSVSYDTEVGGTLAMDRAEGGKKYTLRSDWDSMGFRAPDKKTFDKWLIDGVAYEAGITYVVEHDVSVTPLWKDVKSDDDDGPKPPVPTPDDPVKPPVPAPDDKWHNHKGNGTNNGANGAAQSPKTFDAGIAAYAAAALLSLSGAAGLRRRKKSGK